MITIKNTLLCVDCFFRNKEEISSKKARCIPATCGELTFTKGGFPFTRYNASVRPFLAYLRDRYA